MATCCAAQHIRACMCTFFHSKWIMKVRVSRTCLSYEGRPDRLKASDARLKFEMGHCYSSFLASFPFTLTNF